MCPKATWDKARDEFIATGLTRKAIADKFGIPYSTLRHRAKVEGWAELRQARIQRDRDTAIAQQDAEVGIDLEDKVEERKRWLRRARRLGEALDLMIEQLFNPEGTYNNPDQVLKLTHAATRVQDIAFKAMNIVNDGADSSAGYKPPVIEIRANQVELGDFPARYTEAEGDASDA